MDYGIFQTCLNNFVRNSENLQNPVLQSDSFLIFVVFDNYLWISSFMPLIVLWADFQL